MNRQREAQAVEALRTLLTHASAIKVQEITTEGAGTRRRKDILARIDVYGRRHTLFCRLKTRGEAHSVKIALREFRRCAVCQTDEVTPVLIAPRLSREAKALCRQGQLSFLDFDGNAHIELPEYFFCQTCMPARTPSPGHGSS